MKIIALLSTNADSPPQAHPAAATVLAALLVFLAMAGCSDDAPTAPDAGPATDAVQTGPDATQPTPDAGPGDVDAMPPCGTNPGEAPTVEIVFPPQNGVSDAAEVTIRGTASDASTIASLTLNGVPVETTDGFATWQLNVPLTLGDNQIVAASEDDDGNLNCAAAEVSIAQLPAWDFWPWAMAVDAANGRAFIGDGELYKARVVSMDLTTGYRTVISSLEVGAGPPIPNMDDVAYDASNNRVLVNNYSQVMAVDIATGDRTVVASSTVGTGPSLSPGGPLVYDAANGRALMAKESSSAPAILAIDPGTGDRTVLSDNATGAGPAMDAILAMDIDPANGRVLITDDSGQLLAVSLTTGDRTLLATGTWNAESMVHDAANNRALVIDYYRFNGMGPSDEVALLAVDLATGQTTVISGIANGAGPMFYLPESLGLDVANNRALVTDRSRSFTFAVDLTTGDRTVFSATHIGSGPRPFVPNTTFLDGANDRLISANSSAITAMDRTTGDRTELMDISNGPFRIYTLYGLTPYNNTLIASQHGPMAPYLVSFDLAAGQYRSLSDASTGSGPALEGVAGLALDSANERALVGASIEIDEEEYEGYVAWIDLNTGDRSILADFSTGSDMLEPVALVLDEANNRALVFDRGALDEKAQIVAVDLTTGSPTVVSSDAVGAGMSLEGLTTVSMVHDVANNRLLMTLLLGDDPLIAVDLATGDRTVVSQRGVAGRGPALSNPWGVVMAPSGEYVYVGDRGLLAMVAVDLVTGDRVILSR